jgi:hypothetical protein
MGITPLFTKLNLKDHPNILILNAPSSFEAELAGLEDVAVLRTIKDAKELGFALAFVTKQKHVDTISKAVAKKSIGDAVIWFAYPKGASKKYTCEFNRDTGWSVLGELGFEPVRQVAIDEDWSALRFRRVEFIKTMKREKLGAISKQGQEKLNRAQRPILPRCVSLKLEANFSP